MGGRVIDPLILPLTDHRHRWPRRLALFAYAAVLSVATHWPSLAIGDPESRSRPDLPIHAAAFGLLTALTILASFFGPALSTRNIAISTALAATYSMLDELSQSIPILDRSSTLDDAAANLLGVALAALLAFILSRTQSRRKARAAVIDAGRGES